MKWEEGKTRGVSQKSVLSVRLPMADTTILSSVDGKPTVCREQNDLLQFENKLTWM